MRLGNENLVLFTTQSDTLILSGYCYSLCGDKALSCMEKTDIETEI